MPKTKKKEENTKSVKKEKLKTDINTVKPNDVVVTESETEVSAAEKELNEVEEGVVEIAETCPHEDFIKGAFEALKAHLDVAVIKSKTDKKAALDDLCEGVRRVAVDLFGNLEGIKYEK